MINVKSLVEHTDNFNELLKKAEQKYPKVSKNEDKQ